MFAARCLDFNLLCAVCCALRCGTSHREDRERRAAAHSRELANARAEVETWKQRFTAEAEVRCGCCGAMLGYNAPFMTHMGPGPLTPQAQLHKRVTSVQAQLETDQASLLQDVVGKLEQEYRYW